jgi:hypothetical protein
LEVHTFLSATTGLEALALPEDKAKRMAHAIHQVQRYYTVPAIAPDKLALGMLAYTAATTYVPMAIAAAAETRMRNARPKRDDASNVVPMAAQPATASDWFSPRTVQ